MLYAQERTVGRITGAHAGHGCDDRQPRRAGAAVLTAGLHSPCRFASTPAGRRARLRPIWRFFGADEPNYAYMKDGREAPRANSGSSRRAQVYFRTHNLLTSGDGTPALKWGSTNAYREDAQGKPIYDWTIVDRIFDTYLQHGVKPYVQIGFMPQGPVDEARAVPAHRGRPTAKYDEIFTGWAYPPKDYEKWARTRAYEWAKHCVERYGRAEVEQWYWQSGTRPNIGYWRGTPEEFRKLHDYAIDGVRRALPTARVGGPDTAGHGGQFMRDFLEHALRGTNYATGRSARRSTSSRFTPRAARRSSTATCAWGSPTSSRRSTRASASSRRTRSCGASRS